MIKNYVVISLIIALVCGSCSSSGKKDSAWVSGEIMNPESSYVIITKNNKVLDTVYLDDENRFYYHFGDSLDKGFYTFQHDYESRYETQMFYVEKGDSIQLRLNTRDFDQSLMYSGDGSDANNFLMTLFNDNWDNNRNILRYYTGKPNEFIDKTDSIRDLHEGQLEALLRDNRISKAFKEVAKGIIDYAYYNLHERYYFLVNKYNPEQIENLPSDFLAHRSNIDFNREDLRNYYIYLYFMDDYLKNRAIEHCLDKGASENCFNLRSASNLKRRLKLSDSLFELEDVRSRFMIRFGARLIVQSDTEETVDSMMNFLKTVNYNKDELEEIEGLSHVHKNQFTGHIGQLDLNKPNGEQVKIHVLLKNKPSVFYYWSVFEKSHHLRAHDKIKALKKNLPDLNFIGINIDEDRTLWENSLENYGYDGQFMEYQLVCSSVERDFYRNYLTKLVFVDQSGKIRNSGLSLNSPNLEAELTELLNSVDSINSLTYRR